MSAVQLPELLNILLEYSQIKIDHGFVDFHEINIVTCSRDCIFPVVFIGTEEIGELEKQLGLVFFPLTLFSSVIRSLCRISVQLSMDRHIHRSKKKKKNSVMDYEIFSRM